jgi:hypothetical protein
MSKGDDRTRPMGDERITEAGRLVAEALKDARASGNPYAELSLTAHLAKAGLMRLDIARETWVRVPECESPSANPTSPFGI